MAELLTGAEVIARNLKEQGVEFVAGVVGAGIFSILEATDKQDIRMLHMRDEQNGPYVADGWARATGRVGVSFCDAHYGIVNAISGIAHTYLCRSPIVHITTCRPAVMNERATHRMDYSADICKSFTKWSMRVTEWRNLSYSVQRAFKIASAYPPGPALLEIPTDLQGAKGEFKDQLGYLAGERSAELSKPAGDPAVIEKAVRLLMQAERPLIVGGEDIYWSNASEELKEFVELLRIPVFTTRMARGAVPEDHPLAFRGGYARPFNRRTDVAMGIGLFMAGGEAFGQLPGYSPVAKYIIVSQLDEDLEAAITTEIRILANPKTVLRQMIECAKDLKKTIKEPAARAEWLGAIAKAKDAYRQEQREQKEKLRAHSGAINPHFLAHEICDFLDPSATIIEDSMYMSHFTSPKFVARFGGQVLDASGTVGVGHSVGMAMGAQLARPGRQVLALIGDGGFGIAGMDLETAARYSLPIVFVLNNNSGWTSPETQKPDYVNLGFRFPLPIKDSFEMLPDIRYDKMFTEMGCHGEYVTEQSQIRPALERSFNSGKPALINVVTDHKIYPPFVMEGAGRLMY